MAFCTLIVVVLAVVHYTNGYPNDMSEEQGVLVYGTTTLYINKPPNYHKLQAEMDELLELEQKWVGFKPKELDDDDDDDDDDDGTPNEYPGDENNCGTTTEITTPYVVEINNATENSSYYVVQSTHFKQSFRVTKCRKLHTPCMKSLAEFLTSTCENKMGSVSLYIYDEKVKKFVYKDVDIPVCCACNFGLMNKKK